MADNKNTQATDVNEQIKIRMDKLKALQDAGKDPFQITKYDVTHHTDEIRAIYEAHEKELLGDRPAVNTEGLDEQQAREAINADYNERRAIMDASPIEVSFAGRMMFKRVMGKASFCNIADLKGKMQAYISKDAIGEEAYADFKKSDIGDIFGVKGFIFRTKTGEISVHVEELTLLSKSLQVLPEKFHGITDTDMRYRQRYVDLIMNPEVKDTFVKRSKIIKEIRNFLDGRNFMEVETPTLVSNAGGAAARPLRLITMHLMRMLSFVFHWSCTLKDLLLVVLREFMKLDEYIVTKVLIQDTIPSLHLWNSIRHIQIMKA